MYVSPTGAAQHQCITAARRRLLKNATARRRNNNCLRPHQDEASTHEEFARPRPHQHFLCRGAEHLATSVLPVAGVQEATNVVPVARVQETSLNKPCVPCSLSSMSAQLACFPADLGDRKTPKHTKTQTRRFMGCGPHRKQKQWICTC